MNQDRWRFFRVLPGATLFLLPALVLVPGCSQRPDPWNAVPGSPRVLACFPPLYCFTQNVVGKEPVAVMSLLTTVGPHDYNPVAADNLRAARCDVFLENGLTLDTFVAKLLKSAGNHTAKVVALAEAIPESQRLDFVCNHPGHKHGHHDPHVWLGIPEAKLVVEKIRATLSELDPAKKTAFDANTKVYLGQLDELQEEGKKAFAGKTNRKVVTMHESLGYFARTFGLEIVGSIQPQPGIEAGGKDLAELVELCKKKEVAVILYEPQFNKATAELLEKELRSRGQQVRLVLFDTLETANPSDLTPAFYITKMRANIKTLAEALP